MLYDNIVVELQSYDRKSFYGKAQVIYSGNDIFLQSYNTIVCGIVNDQFERYWPGYSCTTMRHINSFIIAFSHKAVNVTCESGGKKWWQSLQVKEAPIFSVSANYRASYY